MGRLVSAAEAAALLRIDVRSLYAYVSRGVLARAGTDERHRSRYDSDEVELLARRGRPRTGAHPRAGIDVVIGSSVTALGDGWIRYRGHDLLDLTAQGVGFEEVAELLWTGDLGAAARWSLPPGARTRITRVLAPFDPDADVLDWLAAAVAATHSLLPVGAAAPLILALVHAVPDRTAGPAAVDGSVAGELFRRLSPLRATPARLRALDLALVLLADHELATSTLAVRVAASTGTSLVGAVLAGLGALGGPAHGAAAGLLHRALGEGRRPGPEDARAGFGHPVHRSGDPRTAPLLAAVARIATPRDRSLIQVPRSAEATVDYALAALCHVARMPPDAATAVFAVARAAGWMAHAREEYAEKPLRYRARALARDLP